MIDKSKQYRTRDGREVRIYATDGEVPYCVHGAVLNSHGWDAHQWDENGRWDGTCREDESDLIEVKPRIKREIWVNVYPHRMGVPHGNKAYVDMHRGKDAIACVKLTIDVEEGEGL